MNDCQHETLSDETDEDNNRYCVKCGEWQELRPGFTKVEPEDILASIAALNTQLHTARYAYHCQIKHKYLVMSVLPPEQAAEQYRLAIENYDNLIAEAVNGHLTEANQTEMDKGIGV